MSDDEILDQVSPEVPQQAPAHNMTQEQIDKIVKSRIAREREKWEAAQHAPQMPTGAGGVSLDTVKQMMQTEMAKIREEAERTAEASARKTIAQKVIADFQSGLEKGKAKYPDFEEVVTDSEIHEMAPMVQLIAQIDNKEDVTYELAKNGGKIGSILALYNQSPRRAMKEVVKLSESIKANQKAATTNKPHEPLSRISSSSTNSDDGNPGIRDYMKQDWLRK